MSDQTETETGENAAEASPSSPCTVTHESPVLVRIEAEIPADEVRTELNKGLRELGGDVAMRGFRKGKVPRKMLEQRFGKVVGRQVAERLAAAVFIQAVRSHDLRIVAEPVYEHDLAQRGEPLKVVAHVEVKPQIQQLDLDGIEVERSLSPVEEPAIDQQLETLRRKLAQVRTLDDRPAKPGDVLRIDYVGTVEGVDDAGLKGEDVEVELGSGRFLPGLEDALVGAEKGKRSFDVQMPEDFSRAELRGCTVHFDVVVKDVLEVVLPAVDDAFAKDLDESLAGLGELRARIRKDLERQERERADGEVRDKVIDAALERNPFDVPPTLVARYLDSMFEETRRSLRRFGLSEEDVGGEGREGASRLNRDEFDSDMRARAHRSAAAGLLVEAFARQQGIEVAGEAVEERLRTIAEETRVELPRLRAYYRQEGRFESLRRQLQDEKAMAVLLERAGVGDVDLKAPEVEDGAAGDSGDAGPAEVGQNETADLSDDNANEVGSAADENTGEE